MQFVKPQLFTEALDKLGSKTLIASGLNSEQWSRVPLALRERAYFSSQVESTRFLQRSRAAIADFLQGAREEITLPDGTKTTALKVGSQADFVKIIQDFAIKEGMGPLDPADAGTIKDITSESRLKLIINTQVRQAQDYGNWKQGQDTDILNAFPAQRFIREREVKEPRDIHHLHEGEVQLKTDLGFWKTLNLDFHVPWGPWAWGCGHDVEDVDRAEAERLGLLTPGQQVQPVEQQFNQDLQASVKNLDPDLQRELKEAFGDQVIIEGDSARWAAQPGSSVPSVPSVPSPKQPAPMGHPTLDGVLKQLGLHEKETATAADMTRLVDELREDHPLDATQVLHSIDAPAAGLLSKSGLHTDLQEFVNFIPSDKLRSLPKVRISADPHLDARGQYSPSSKSVSISPSVGTKEQRRRTLFHELMHWLHIEGSDDFRTAIKNHFEARTKGETIQQLGEYASDVVGKKDKWYEPYAGRIYHGKLPAGTELPTRYIEWLTMPPARQADLWNDADFRETMLIVLQALF